MRRIIKSLSNLIMIGVISIMLVACNDSVTKESSQLSVYYIDKTGTRINSEEYKSNETVENKIINNLIGKLSKDGKDSKNKRAIPKNVIVNGFNLKNGIVTIDFDNGYESIKNDKEVFVRAAIVLTLIQIPAVKGIAFTVDGEPYEKITGQAVGVMDANSFVVGLRGDKNKYAKSDFVLYYSNEDGTALKKYYLKEASYNTLSKEEYIVKKLIKGPKKSGYMPTLSSNIKVNSVNTSNNICYVDFDKAFLDEQSRVSNEIVIYSIVDSLSELNEIHKVQITVDGSSDNVYHREIDLKEPFIRNLDLVEKNN